MNDAARESLNLGQVHQVGFVVRDMEAAMKIYAPLFGEFKTMDAADMEWDYYGEPEVSTIKVALAKSGDVEIELIQWVSGKTPHKDFLDAGREGLQHLSFIVDNLEAKMKEAEALGYRAAWYKRFGEGLGAAYMKRDDDPLYLEFFENHHG